MDIAYTADTNYLTDGQTRGLHPGSVSFVSLLGAKPSANSVARSAARQKPPNTPTANIFVSSNQRSTRRKRAKNPELALPVQVLPLAGEALPASRCRYSSPELSMFSRYSLSGDRRIQDNRSRYSYFPSTQQE